MGPPTASWRDVQDFCDVQGLPFNHHEKTLLVKLATLRASIQAEQSAERIKQDGAQGQNRSG